MFHQRCLVRDPGLYSEGWVPEMRVEAVAVPPGHNRYGPEVQVLHHDRPFLIDQLEHLKNGNFIIGNEN